jgi:hypothetical protein
MNDLQVWSTVSDSNKTFETIGGNIAGGYSPSPNVFYVDKTQGDPLGYGSGSAWHGPCVQRMLSQSQDNWRVEARVNFVPSSADEQGKMSMILLDPNGKAMGLIELKDADGREDVNLSISIGGTNGQGCTIYSGGSSDAQYTHTVIAGYRRITNTTQVKHTRYVRKRVRGRWYTVPDVYYTTSTYYTYDPYYGTVVDNNPSGGNLIPAVSEYANVYGIVRLEKVGQKFTASFTWLNQDLTQSKYSQWVFNDTKNLYTTKLAGVALWTAANGTASATNWMKWTNLKVYNLNNENPNNNPPIIAHAGDEIQIDCEAGVIFKNGQRFMTTRSLNSQWLKLQGGDTTAVGVEPFDSATWNLSYRPKQL